MGMKIKESKLKNQSIELEEGRFNGTEDNTEKCNRIRNQWQPNTCNGHNTEVETTTKNEVVKENVVMDFFRARIHRPVYRMFVAGILEIFFLILLFFTISDLNDKPDILNLSWYGVVTWIFVLNYLVDDLV